MFEIKKVINQLTGVAIDCIGEDEFKEVIPSWLSAIDGSKAGIAEGKEYKFYSIDDTHSIIWGTVVDNEIKNARVFYPAAGVYGAMFDHSCFTGINEKHLYYLNPIAEALLTKEIIDIMEEFLKKEGYKNDASLTVSRWTNSNVARGFMLKQGRTLAKKKLFIENLFALEHKFD